MGILAGWWQQFVSDKQIDLHLKAMYAIVPSGLKDLINAYVEDAVRKGTTPETAKNATLMGHNCMTVSTGLDDGNMKKQSGNCACIIIMHGIPYYEVSSAGGAWHWNYNRYIDIQGIS